MEQLINRFFCKKTKSGNRIELLTGKPTLRINMVTR